MGPKNTTLELKVALASSLRVASRPPFAALAHHHAGWYPIPTGDTNCPSTCQGVCCLYTPSLKEHDTGPCLLDLTNIFPLPFTLRQSTIYLASCVRQRESGSAASQTTWAGMQKRRWVERHVTMYRMSVLAACY